MDLLEPSPQSLAFRANLASLVSPLRRLKPRVPFFRLPAHRIPTLWTWYRGLLRYAPTENVCASFADSGCDTDASAPSRKDQATCSPVSRPESSTCWCEENEGDVADWVQGAYAKWPCANHVEALNSGLTSSSVRIMGMSTYARCSNAGIGSWSIRTSSDYGDYKSTMH